MEKTGYQNRRGITVPNYLQENWTGIAAGSSFVTAIPQYDRLLVDISEQDPQHDALKPKFWLSAVDENRAYPMTISHFIPMRIVYEFLRPHSLFITLLQRLTDIILIFLSIFKHKLQSIAQN
jgi:hypothetical protein